MSFTRRSSSSAPFLTDNSESAASFSPRQLYVDTFLSFPTYLAKSIEDIVEKEQNLPFCYFSNVVHAFACVVSHACILIGETSQDGRNDLLKVLSDVLLYLHQLQIGTPDSGFSLPSPRQLKQLLSLSIRHSWRVVDAQRMRNRGRAGRQSWLFCHVLGWHLLLGQCALNCQAVSVQMLAKSIPVLTYSRAPCFLLSYSLSFRARWTDESIAGCISCQVVMTGSVCFLVVAEISASVVRF